MNDDLNKRIENIIFDVTEINEATAKFLFDNDREFAEGAKDEYEVAERITEVCEKIGEENYIRIEDDEEETEDIMEDIIEYIYRTKKEGEDVSYWICGSTISHYGDEIETIQKAKEFLSDLQRVMQYHDWALDALKKVASGSIIGKAYLDAFVAYNSDKSNNIVPSGLFWSKLRINVSALMSSGYKISCGWNKAIYEGERR
jgi:hypothetical protein